MPKKNLDRLFIVIRLLIDFYFLIEFLFSSLLIYYIVSKKGGVHGSMHVWYHLSFINYLIFIIIIIFIAIIGFLFGVKDYPLNFFNKKYLIFKLILFVILFSIEIYLSSISGKG